MSMIEAYFRQKESAKGPISQFKLEMLVFCSNRIHQALHGSPLIDEPASETYVIGLKGLVEHPELPDSNAAVSSSLGLSPETMDFLDRIHNTYGKLQPEELANVVDPRVFMLTWRR